MLNFPFRIKTLDEYKKAHSQSIEHPDKFWDSIANNFYWRKKWDKVLDGDFSTAKIEWFKGGKLNITENCIDRHLKNTGNKAAIIWEPNNPKEEHRILSYSDLYNQVCKFANVLRKNGVQKGDRVCIYMGMVPELAIAILACARIGAIHSVIFAGFSAQSIADRLQDSKAEFIITSDGAYRGPKTIPLKSVVDAALITCPFVKRVVVHLRTGDSVNMIKGRDVWWNEEFNEMKILGLNDCIPEEMDSEDPLFILYTSGSTGKPKGVVHSCGGYMVFTGYTFVNVFQYENDNIHFCTADIGWITGHSYLLYGPLSVGATTLMFEGIPTWPSPARYWEIVDKFEVNILYTAPTAIRTLMSYGDEPFEGRNLSSLRVLGSVGEPINEEAWYWYDQKVGKGKCPIVDTWWQTETGGILISNLAGITTQKPSYATLPLPGVTPVLMDEKGNEVHGNPASGNLCIKSPWPSIIRTTFDDHMRYRQTYFAQYKGLYFTGDGASRDEHGNYRITGRVDDVLNISGHRIGTAEVENAINSNSNVIESAVVGYPHPIKGQAIFSYVILNTVEYDCELLKRQILETITKAIGAIAKPERIIFVSALPKTRSGKIMRRILRKIAEGDTSNLGDLTTLIDPSVVDNIIAIVLEENVMEKN